MERAQLGTLINFLCTSHAPEVPIVTLHEQRWAYCPGGYVAAQQGHAWTAIDPANRSELNPRHIGFVQARRLSESA